MFVPPTTRSSLPTGCEPAPTPSTSAANRIRSRCRSSQFTTQLISGCAERLRRSQQVQHDDGYASARGLLIRDIRRIQVAHVFPHLVPFIAGRFSPAGFEGLGCDLHVETFA